MRGIILAGGRGSRLYPLTLAVSKQLLPVFDKPMIYYPLSTLMQAGIRDILVIATPYDLPAFRRLLGDGSNFGIRLDYAVQPEPDGIAQAFVLGRNFIGSEPVALILGDNVFHGAALSSLLRQAMTAGDGATIFAAQVDEPEHYGVVTFDLAGAPQTIVEKPRRPRSNWAVTGLYVYDRDVVELAAALRPSARGELEITDLNLAYLQRGRLRVHRLDPATAWLDAGTPAGLYDAATLVRRIERKLATLIACPEAIALEQGWLAADAVLARADRLGATAYAAHLRRCVPERTLA